MHDTYTHEHAHSHTLGFTDPHTESDPHIHPHNHAVGKPHEHLGDTNLTTEYGRRANAQVEEANEN
ncbi:hypothetical protein LCGC14_1539230 [marine sediment metagenome]|uniref:Uncharacterized protein n=1 Tax=marine sediment metagenome TaxID=412755 RepID=A0A0F9ITM2_9ZZZZ